ncbi:unnamed protein product [Choristocarpus tenellus]
MFQFMDAPTLCSATEVSQEWKSQGNDDLLWKRLCRSRQADTLHTWGIPPEAHYLT